MSRIEEALRRAGGAAGARSEPGEPTNGHELVPDPWFTTTEALEVHGRPAPAAPAAPVATTPPPALPGLLADERALPLSGFSNDWADRLAVAPGVNPMLVEQFRRLAASLYHAQTAGSLKTLMVTSAWEGDGKTLTALNLALVLSESYRRRVLLVDADLRRPSISNLSAISSTCGLSDGLKAKTDQKLSVLKLTDTLTLLPAGRPDPDPMSSLTSDRMRRVIEEAASRFDWVILDAPPVGPIADANLLAAMTDAVLLVIRANHTQHASIQRAIDSLGREKIFGVVLNAVEEATASEYQRTYGAQYTPTGGRDGS